MKTAKDRRRGSVASNTQVATIERLEGRQLLSAAAHVVAKGVTTPYQTTEGSALSGITVATFTDAAGEPLSNFSATIVWGDPTTTPGGNSSAGVITTDGAGDFTVSGSHTYVVPAAARIITVKIVDTDGSKATVFSHAKVADAAITATGTTITAVKNSALSVTTATFTDADPIASINWGDGTATAGTITQDPSTKVFTVTGQHAYLVAKTYTVTTTIHDRVGTSKATATTPTTIIPPFPTTSPSLVNDYTGTLTYKILGVKTSYSFELNITGQTIDSITGSISLDGNQIVSGTLDAGVIKGVVDGELSNGNFIFTYTGSTDVTISGHISSDGMTITSGLLVVTNLHVSGIKFSSLSAPFTASVMS